ncbi:MAG: peptidase M15A, partial [Pseudomonadota bacterium]
MALEIFTEARLDELLAAATTEAELDEIEALWDASIEAERLAAIGNLRKNSIKLLGLVDKMATHIKKLRSVSGLLSNDLTDKMLTEIGDIHARFHDDEGSKRTFSTTDDVVENKNDEDVVSGSDDKKPLPAPTGEVLDTPTPLSSSKYVALADEYVRFFNGAAFRVTHRAKVEKFANIAVSNKSRYEAVGEPLKIPWWFIAGIHQLESTYNFKAHLHNGDSLKSRTIRVPAGRPVTGSAPFTWEESARDSLSFQKLDNLKDWSLPRALWRWERYNGFGYRKRGVPSPYLWSFSSIYLRGKYVKDGKFDGGATSAQCGTAVLLKALMEMGEVDLETDVIAEPGTEPADTADQNSTDPTPNTDQVATSGHPFEQFFI